MKAFILFFLCFAALSPEAEAQVTQINNNNSLQIVVPLANNKTILASNIDSSIWVTDGTPGGTAQLSTTIKFDQSDSWGLLAGKLVFAGNTDTTGNELFITDGTPGGTMLVKNIAPGTAGSNPETMVPLNGSLYFSAFTPAEGRELWKTDGTSAGTSMVKDIIAGPQSGISEPAANGLFSNQLFSTGTYLLFAAGTPSKGIELWKSTGTEGGTELLKDISPNADSSNPQQFYKYNNIVLFTATDTTHGQEIWKTDGTAGGTELLKDIFPGKKSSTSLIIPGIPPFVPDFSIPILIGFHLFNNALYFHVTDGTSLGQLWRSDGTSTNTTLVKDIVPGNNYTQSYILPTDAANLSSRFIFPVANFKDRSELWESDGTPNGTKLFKSFTLTGPGELPYIMVGNNVNFEDLTITQSLFQGNKFFFTAGDSLRGRELWISDGTDSSIAHTSMVKDINPNAANGTEAFTSYVYTSAAVYFGANDSTHGVELWKSDGTLNGTSLVEDINTGEEGANPELPFFLVNGKIIFSATDGDDDNTDLFVLDSTFSPLPIRLSEFTVTLKSTDAVLQWSTLTEVNTKNFIIQRSYDGQHFENIGSVAASGNTFLRHNYSLVDANVTAIGKNVIYYRVVTYDKDGKTQTTNIIFVKLKGTLHWTVGLLSNPVQSFANVIINGVNGELSLSIRDIGGKTLYSSSRQNVNGQINIPVASLQKGMYFLVAENNHERKTIQFIKQ